MNTVHTIIVNYNSGDWLYRSIHSALKFSTGDVTVVDNHSDDNSIDIAKNKIRESDSINWILNGQNVGFAAANNQVLKSVKADFVILQNPDCEIKEQTISNILTWFKCHPQLGLASCIILNEDGSIQNTSARRFPTPHSALVRMLKLHLFLPSHFKNFDFGDTLQKSDSIEFVDAISGAFMVVRMDALKTVGLLDEQYFMHCEDLDWCKRFQQENFKVGVALNAEVIHAKGISSRHRPVGVLYTLHLGMNRFFNKFYYGESSFLISFIVKVGIFISFIARALPALIFGQASK